VVASLYTGTLEDGCGGLTALTYESSCWGDAEAAELSATLQEVRFPDVLTLDLRHNDELKSAEALAGIGALSSLQTLNLDGCRGLAALPETVGALSSLQTLNLNRCSGLTVLPEAIGALSSLQTLKLGAGERDLDGFPGLTALPEAIGTLSSLQSLDLAGCSGLAALPEAIGALSSLRRLSLDGCIGLTALPEAIGALSSLQTLNLDRCFGLTVLPEAIGALSSLRTLSLSRCRLTALPDLSGLRELSVEPRWEWGERVPNQGFSQPPPRDLDYIHRRLPPGFEAMKY